MTIRLRLTIWYAATLVVLFAVVGGITWLQYRRIVRETIDQELAARADDVRLSLGRSATASPDTSDPAWQGIFAAVYAADGALLSASQDTPAGLARPALGRGTASIGPRQASYAIDVVAGPGGTTVVAGRPLAQIDAGLADLARLMLAAGMVATLASIAGGWWLAARALRPVGAMVREVNAIKTGDLDRRLDVPPADDEIGRLGRTLNALLERVSETVRRERRFIATASHDLRTPIATLQGELELAVAHEHDPEALLAAIRLARADAVRLGALASDLLRLAEADASGRELLRGPVSICDLVESVVARFAPLAAARAVRIATLAPDVTVAVDRVRLEQAIGNLLSNAILESTPGSDVALDLRVARGTAGAADELEVDVLDRGPGVPASIRDTLFQPFGAPSGRDGRTGLGLATAAAAVEAHGGRILYRDRPDGGSWFSLSIPLRPSGA